MINFEKEEFLRLIKLSKITVDESKIDSLREDLQTVLNYTNELSQIKVDAPINSKANINEFRDDKVVECNSEEVLAQAPDREEDYFVVPKIL